MAEQFNQRQGLDTEGGLLNKTPVDVTITTSSGRIAYEQKGVPLNTPQFEQMQKDVKRVTSGKTVVAHNVNNDLKQIGMSPKDFTGTIDTQNMGSIKHTSNRNHDPAEDARQSLNLANQK